MSTSKDMEYVLQKVLSLPQDSSIEKALKKHGIQQIEDWYDIHGTDFGRLTYDDVDSSGTTVETKLTFTSVNKVKLFRNYMLEEYTSTGRYVPDDPINMVKKIQYQ